MINLESTISFHNFNPEVMLRHTELTLLDGFHDVVGDVPEDNFQLMPDAVRKLDESERVLIQFSILPCVFVVFGFRSYCHVHDESCSDEQHCKSVVQRRHG